MKSLIQKLAKKYDPSLSGAIGMVGGMILLGAAVAIPVAAVIGAGIAGFAGASIAAGALWGGGIVAGAGAALVGAIALPQAIYAQCYKHTLRQHVAAGGSTSGMKWVPGIENMRQAPSPLKPGVTAIFRRSQKKKDAPGNNKKPPKPPKPPKL